MRILLLTLFSILAAFPAEPPRPGAVLAAFNTEEMKRRQFTQTVEATLTLTSEGGKVQIFPSVVRRVDAVDNGVCTVFAAFSDGQPVYGKDFKEKLNCVELQSEISDVSVSEILSHPDLHANPAPDQDGNWVFRKSSRFSLLCLESSEARVLVHPRSLHPIEVVFTAGVGCIPKDERSAYRPGSVSRVFYGAIDGVYQITRITENFDAHFRSTDRVPRLTFYFRKFEVQGKPFSPSLRLEKSFSAFSKEIEPFVGPKTKPNKEDVSSTLSPFIPPDHPPAGQH